MTLKSISFLPTWHRKKKKTVSFIDSWKDYLLDLYNKGLSTEDSELDL